MKKFLPIFLFIFKINICLAEIITAPNIEILERELNKADTDTLLLFGINEVLTKADNEFLLNHPIRKNLIEELRKKYTHNERKILFSDLFQKRTVRLINDKIPDLLNSLKQKNIPMTALTAWYTGDYGTISEIEKLKLNDLNRLGISFSDTTPFRENYSFPEFTTEHGTPMIKFGIIFTAVNDRGKVLKAALEKANLKFSKIIFIDDEIKYILPVKEVCQELNIEFLGINYTEVLSTPMPELDETKEKIRFEYLEKYHKWLLDKELDEIL